MADQFDVEYLEKGDTFEGGPIEQSYFISAVLAAGGEIQINGNTVLIVDLPKKETAKAKAPVSSKKEEPKPEPVVEAVEVAKEDPSEAKEEELKEEAPKAKSVSRKPKAAPAEETTKE